METMSIEAESPVPCEAAQQNSTAFYLVWCAPEPRMAAETPRGKLILSLIQTEGVQDSCATVP